MTPEHARTAVEEFEKIRASLAEWSRKYGVPGQCTTMVVQYDDGPAWHAPGDLHSPSMLRLAGFRPTCWTGDRPLREWRSPDWPLIRAHEWGDDLAAAPDLVVIP